MSTLAVFIALGGTGYAAVTLSANSVGTRELKNGAVTTTKLHTGAVNGAAVANDALTGRQIKESTLGTVRTAARAGNATKLGGATAASYRMGCPDAMLKVGSLCVDRDVRSPADWKTAAQTCGLEFRRLPDAGELALAFNVLSASQSDEWTAEIHYDGTTFRAAFLGQTTSRKLVLGAFGIDDQRFYRCVATASNA